MTDGFGEVNNCLNSLIDAILNRVSEETMSQKVGEISIGKQIMNVWILSYAIETNNENSNASLQQFQDLSLDINELSTQKMV